MVFDREITGRFYLFGPVLRENPHSRLDVFALNDRVNPDRRYTAATEGSQYRPLDGRFDPCAGMIEKFP